MSDRDIAGTGGTRPSAFRQVLSLPQCRDSGEHSGNGLAFTAAGAESTPGAVTRAKEAPAHSSALTTMEKAMQIRLTVIMDSRYSQKPFQFYGKRRVAFHCQTHPDGSMKTLLQINAELSMTPHFGARPQGALNSSSGFSDPTRALKNAEMIVSVVRTNAPGVTGGRAGS